MRRDDPHAQGHIAGWALLALVALGGVVVALGLLGAW